MEWLVISKVHFILVLVFKALSKLMRTLKLNSKNNARGSKIAFSVATFFSFHLAKCVFFPEFRWCNHNFVDIVSLQISNMRVWRAYSCYCIMMAQTAFILHVEVDMKNLSSEECMKWRRNFFAVGSCIKFIYKDYVVHSFCRCVESH